MLRFNNKLIRLNGNLAAIGYVPPEPPLPAVISDMDFIYLANDFDGTQIPNKASGTNAFGPYLQEGTITKNGSGADCYLSNGFGNNRLYIELTQEQLYKMYPYNIGDTYTFFLRAYQNTSRSTSGIITWRTSGYRYMIRCQSGQLQLHTDSSCNLGSDFLLTSDKVYKVIATHNTNFSCIISAKNLMTGVVSNSYTYVPNMDTKMSSFTGYNSGSSESQTDAIYGIAGIPRATTEKEDEIIKNALLNQSL